MSDTSILNRVQEIKIEAPRITIYGKPGIGKSTLASQFPKPLFLLTEKNGITGHQSLGIYKNFIDIWQDIDELLKIDNLPFETIVIDSISELDELVKARTLEKSPFVGKEKRQAEILTESWGGYGAGFERAASLHRVFKHKLDKFQDKGIAVVYVAHLEVKNHKSPEDEDYNILSIRMNSDKSRLIYIDDVDSVLYCKEMAYVVETESKRKIVKGTGTRVISAYSNEVYVSKNRFSINKDIPMSFDELSKYIPFYTKNK
jgi:hypothetical protein